MTLSVDFTIKSHLVLSFILILFSGSCHNDTKEDHRILFSENELAVTPIYKGSYFLGNQRDYGAFFLFDIKLINNTKSPVEFWTLSASPIANIVIDPDQLDYFVPHFSRNLPRIINLQPRQEFVVSVVLNRNGKLNIDSLRFGFIINKPKYKNRFSKELDYEIDPEEELLRMRNQNKNIIWSKKIELFKSNEYLYQIRTNINDSTYSIVPKERLNR